MEPSFHDLPMGFSMLLAQDAKAMSQFAGLPEEEQQAVIDGARHIHSRAEMESYIRRLF
ncbi:MAG: hypothetical protein PHE47_09470 [Oscillospiraceae bacterium]|nr:hypothetical protein [Oscillospiraceae bacterium]